MADQHFDLFVIGGGSGGVRAARVAASLGARVALCEDRSLGGTCVNAGCVPKKLLVYGSELGAAVEDAAGYGWTVGEARFDWATLRERKDREIARLNGVYRRLLEGSGVTVVEGRGRLTDPRTVSVARQVYTADHVLIATGSRPWVPALPGRDLVVTSDEMFHLDALPERAIVVGAGYIGVEFAGILSGLGCEVTLVHRDELPLGGFDVDIRRAVAAEMTRRGIRLVLGMLLERVDREAAGLVATLASGERLHADLVLAATGRTPNTESCDLGQVGVVLNSLGAVVVDRHYRTNLRSIHAVGDVIGRVPLTPVALAEGTAVARTLFGGEGPQAVDYDAIPTAVFSQPAVGTVGLSEAAARARHGRVRVYRSEFTPMKHTLTGRGERTMMKAVVDDATDRVLGFHMVGAEAGEIVQGLAVALRCGVTKAQLDQTIGVHPTAAEEFVTMRTPVPEA